MSTNLVTSALPHVSPWTKHPIKVGPLGFQSPGTSVGFGEDSTSPVPRIYHSSSVISDSSGDIFIFGGESNGQTKNDTWIIRLLEDQGSRQRRNLDPTCIDVMTNLLETTGEAPSPRIGHAFTTNAIPATRHWTKLDTRPAPRPRIAPAACISGNHFIVYGGSGEEDGIIELCNDMWKLDLDSSVTKGTPKWERIQVTPDTVSPDERMGHIMVAHENKLYMYGGRHCKNHMWKDTWCFDMDARAWARVQCTSNCPPPRTNHSATLVKDVIYMFGGYDDQQEFGDILMEDPTAEQRWYRLPSMDYEPSPRSGHILATTKGRVLVFGGIVRRSVTPEMAQLVYVLNTNLINFSEQGRGPTFMPIDEWSGSTRIGDTLEGEFRDDLTVIRSDTDDTRVDKLVTALENLGSNDPKKLDQSTAAFGTQDTITRTMPATEVLKYLIAHGCRDISKEVNILQVSDYPMSFGGFGDVYCATLQNGDRVGIKCVRMLTNSSLEGKKILKSAAHELYVWSKCKHPNVIELLGVMLFRDQIAMVSPWLDNGHLRTFLVQNPQIDRCALCAQVADGVAYLHQQSIVHGDLKPENILISQDHTPRLTDFGNSALAEYTLQFTHSSTVQGMSLRWAAPEIIQEESKPTHASDVYALGMEVISREMPYAGAKDSAIVFKVVGGVKPTRPEAHIPKGIEPADRLWSMLNSCWANEPQERPNAFEVKNLMAKITPQGLLSHVDLE
ncbi:Egl-10, and Pleckstrin (DEP), partial [Rhizoctonia solani]